MKCDMDIKKIGWIIFAILVAVGFIFLKSYFIDECPICDWSICLWVAGIAMIVIFIIGALCGRKKK